MNSVLKYCICVIDKQTGEITYYPKFQITNVSKDGDITIANGADTATMKCNEDNHLLNKSPYDMFELDTFPIVSTSIINPLNDISKFVKNVNDKKFTPFCAPMQFWMNPQSVLTGNYLPKELILMAGITEEPKPNQKGELMCRMLLNNSVGNLELDYKNNFNSFGTDDDSIKLIKGQEDPAEPIELVESSAKILETSTPGESTAICEFMNKVVNSNSKPSLKGAGLKRNLAMQPIMPRIYRSTQQRRTDYYNYA